MFARTGKIALPLLSTGLLFTLPGCESSGSHRIASVGAQGFETAAASEDGGDGSSGTSGSAGASGSASAGGSGSSGSGSLNGRSALATGGLVGPGGAAGTGLLANTGDPTNRNRRGSGVIVAAGERSSALAQRGTPLAERIDRRLPGNASITGRVIRTIDATGQTLVRSGNGQEYLVDGLAAAPGQLVTVNARDNQIIGRSGDKPLIAGSLVSPTQQQGELATAGADSGGRTVTVGTPAGGTAQGNGTSANTGVVQGVVQGVTGRLPKRR